MPCTYSAQDGGWCSALSAYSAAHFKREFEKRKIRVCVSVLLYTVMTKHTNQIFSSCIFSYDMLCTRCSNECRKSRGPSTIQSTVCARPIEILAYVVKVCILNKKFLCLQVECCLKDPYRVYLKPFCCTIIPYTHTIFGAPKGHFLTIREWSYDYETYANRFYGSNIVQ